MRLFNNKARMKGFLGIFLIIVVLTGIYFWEDMGRENLMYQRVIVLKEDVKKNTIIKKDMLGTMKIDKTTLIKGTITDPDQIIGKETLNYIPRGLQLTEMFFEDPELATGDGKFIFSIPDNWVYSYPQSLRRGDTVYLYPVIDKKNIDSNTVIDMETPIETAPDVPVVTPIVIAKVAYAKDNSNREVEDADLGSAGNKRLNGTSVVGTIELVVDDNEYKKLLQSYNDGYSLLILYN